MKTKIIYISPTWRHVLNAARKTVNKEEVEKEPTKQFRKKILLSEHSVIRMLTVYWDWEKMKTWVSNHIRTHNKFAEHFVSTQRSDRTGIERDKLTQDAPVTHGEYTNAAEIIYTSRKRLCNLPSKETREAWQMFIDVLKEQEPELAAVCVRECVYRGGLCPEINCCGFIHTSKFANELRAYRELFGSNYVIVLDNGK